MQRGRGTPVLFCKDFENKLCGSLVLNKLVSVRQTGFYNIRKVVRNLCVVGEKVGLDF